MPLSYRDYSQIKAGWSGYLTLGDCSIYSENGSLYLGGATSRGGWIRYGPLYPGKFKLRAPLDESDIMLIYLQMTFEDAFRKVRDLTQCAALKLFLTHILAIPPFLIA